MTGRHYYACIVSLYRFNLLNESGLQHENTASEPNQNIFADQAIIY